MRNPLRVLHVIPTFYPATYWGGPIFSTLHLCESVATNPDIDIDIDVVTTDSSGPNSSDRLALERNPTHFDAGFVVWYARKWFGRDFAPRALSLIFRKALKADLIHLTAVYSFTTIPTLAIARLLRKPVVWSPRGAILATDQWGGANNRPLKKLFHFIVKRVLSPQVVVHATSIEEGHSCERALGIEKVFVCANGVDVPPRIPNRSSVQNERLIRLIFLSRVDPKKGLDVLLEAMTDLPHRFVLDIYGMGQPSYILSLKQKIAALDLDERVQIRGQVEGDQKSAAFFSADIFVLPSYSENFGIVVAEALAHGLPVVVSNNTPWRDVERNACGAFVDNNAGAIADAIQEISKSDPRQLGLNGRRWMKSDFAWDAIGQKMAHAYKRVFSLSEEMEAVRRGRK